MKLRKVVVTLYGVLNCGCVLVGYLLCLFTAGLGITISYWRSEDDILEWKRHAAHKVAQSLGIRDWYTRYVTRVARVERAYSESTSPRSHL